MFSMLSWYLLTKPAAARPELCFQETDLLLCGNRDGVETCLFKEHELNLCCLLLTDTVWVYAETQLQTHAYTGVFQTCEKPNCQCHK